MRTADLGKFIASLGQFQLRVCFILNSTPLCSSLEE